MSQTITTGGASSKTGKPKHPGGAPKKRIKKDKFIRVRLSATEHFLVMNKASTAGMKLSDWVRAAIKGARVVPRWTEKDLLVFRTLRAMANNLNQFARVANGGGLFTVARECMKLMEKVNLTIDYLQEKDDSQDT